MKNVWLFPFAVICLQAQRMLFAALCATGIVLSISCGGPSAPTPTPTPTPAPPATAAAKGATVIVSSIVATTEYVPGTAPLSVAYWSTFTVKETGGASGATISTILMHIQNRTPPVTAAEKTYTVNEKITSSGAKTYTFGLVVDAASTTVLLNEVNFIVSYTGDNGVAGSFSTPASTSISAPTPIAATPAPGPSTDAAKYDGTYDFFFKSPEPGGATKSTSLLRFMVIRNSVISSTDGTLAGTVDNFGRARFTAPCPLNNSVGDWVGNMNASARSGSNLGEGQYTCRVAIAGSTNTWQVLQSR
jgi:hypothetical protein